MDSLLIGSMAAIIIITVGMVSIMLLGPPGYNRPEALTVLTELSGDLSSQLRRCQARIIVVENENIYLSSQVRRAVIGLDILSSQIVVMGEVPGFQPPETLRRDRLPVGGASSLAPLAAAIADHYSRGEINELAYSMAVPVEDLAAGHRAAARDLVEYMRRRDRLPALMAEIEAGRPAVDW